ncbi:Uncharacterised protein [Citrobacter amalonaticus]|nr:Uncharacterised protein [Citrobacter amalonaticus]
MDTWIYLSPGFCGGDDAGKPGDRADRLLRRHHCRSAAGSGADQRRGDPVATGLCFASASGIGANPVGNGLHWLRIRRTHFVDFAQRARRCGGNYDRAGRLPDGATGARRRRALYFSGQLLLWLTDRHRRNHSVRPPYWRNGRWRLVRQSTSRSWFLRLPVLAA